MFQMVFLSIIRSSRLHIQQQAHVEQLLLPATQQAHVKQLFDMCLLLYVQSWAPGDGQKDRPKHVELFYKNK
jgi:hypothetical protein